MNVGAPGAYRAVTGTLVSPVVPVLVRPLVRIAKVGDTVRVARSGRPAQGGWSCSRTTASTSLGAASRVGAWTHGRASFPVPGGVDRVRVLVVGGKGWADAASRVVVLGPA